MNGLDGSTETTPTVRPSAADVGDERADEGRLADTRRPGHADGRGAAGRRVDAADDLLPFRRAILDERDRARERAAISGEDAGDERVLRPAGACHRRDSRARAGPGATATGRLSASRSATSEAPLRACSRCRVSSTSFISARRRSNPAGSRFRRARGRDVPRPGREDERERRGGEVDDAGQRPGGARAGGVDEDARARHREAEHGVVARHEHGERPAAHRIRRAPLDEHLVADDRRAVADRRDPGEDGGDGDRRRGRGDAEPDAHHHERAAVDARHPERAQRGRGEEAADREPDTRWPRRGSRARGCRRRSRSSRAGPRRRSRRRSRLRPRSRRRAP